MVKSLSSHPLDLNSNLAEASWGLFFQCHVALLGTRWQSRWSRCPIKRGHVSFCACQYEVSLCQSEVAVRGIRAND
ncbi:hypothetical protein Tco_0609302 [Tanacetum coccineum]